MFPGNSITVFKEVGSGVFSDTVISNTGDKTILSIYMQNSDDNYTTYLYCGNDPIAKVHDKNFQIPNVLTNRICDNSITLTKSKDDRSSSVIITYVPYHTETASTSQIGYNPPIGITSSSSINLYGSFTAGELFIGFLLLLHLVGTLIYTVVKSFGGFKTKKSYIDYGRGQVPQIEEL